MCPDTRQPTLDTNLRPGLAILSNSLTPYRVNLHRLIVAGISELKLHSLITHGPADFHWRIDPPAEINVVHFSGANESALDRPLRKPWAEWRKGGRLIDYLCENNVRAVICNSYRYLSYLRVIDYCWRNSIPLFVRNDSNIRSEPPLSGGKSWLKRRLYAWWLKRSSGVMPMGELGEQFFLKYGADRGRMYKVPYWPDYDSFARFDQDALARFRRTYGLQQGRRRILYSGRLVPAKRVDLLIDAFAAVAAGRPDWDLVIVGDGPLQSELRSQVPQSLRNRVIWTGFLDGDEAKLAYHTADVLVLPSDREPWAVVVQEAMSAGVVVVASDVSGAAHELIKDGASGRIFPAGNLAQLVQAVLDVTESQSVAGYRERAKAALDAWRETVDPIGEIRRALTDFNVLTPSAAASHPAGKSYQACKA